MELTTPNLKGVKSENKRWHVVIVGGGFGGLRAAQGLKSAPVDVTLIDRRNYHLFQPLLYQVATGSLSPGEISAPLRRVFSRQKNTRVLLGEVVDLDAVSKRVVLADLGLPAPELQRAGEPIEVDCGLPIGTLDRAVTCEQSIPLRRILWREVIQRFRDVHQRIASGRVLEIDDPGQVQRALRRHQHIAGMEVVVAEAGSRGAIEQVCRQPSFRDRVPAIQGAFAAAGGIPRAAALLERAAAQ